MSTDHLYVAAVQENETLRKGITSIANAWLERAEQLAREHFNEDSEGWDDDAAYAEYSTLVDCHAEILKLLEE